jgi:hypothetical protein
MPNVQAGHALSILPQEIFRGLVALQSCSAVSMLATLSLLIFLAYDSMKHHFVSPKNRSAALRKLNHPQCYFWLVNLFVAGIPIRKLKMLIKRPRAKYRHPPYESLGRHQLDRPRAFLQFPGHCLELGRCRIGDLDLCRCLEYLFIYRW